MHKSKKYIAPLLVVLAAAVCVVGGILLVKGKDIHDENTLTRYEWLQMLTEECGMKDYANETPYFQDVDSDNAYFAYVQSAVEWKVLEASSSFRGEEAVYGEFIALTAMKTIGESKLKLSLDVGEELTDAVYLELAKAYGLVTEEELEKEFSEEECRLLLEKLKGLHFGEFWKDDHSEVTFKENVKQLEQDEVRKSDLEGNVIEIPKEQLPFYEEGDIIIFEEKTTQIKLARKITRIGADGMLSLSPAELEQAVDSLVVSDVTEVTFQDIVDYYGLEDNTDTASTQQYQESYTAVMEAAVFSGRSESKGYQIVLSTEGEDEERHLEIEITDNATGISYTFPLEAYQVEIEEDEDYSAEINIDRLCVGGQVSYTALDGLQYAEAAVDAHVTVKAEVKGEAEKKIPLFKTPVPLGNGLIGAKIEVYLVISAEGSISVEAEIPVEADVSYEKGKGLKNHGCGISFEKPTVLVDCEASAKLRFEPIFVALGCLDILDAEADIGVSAEASGTLHEDGQLCIDANISFPVFSVAVGEDDDADTLIGTLGLSGEWEVITSDNAPIKWELHYEKLTDGTGQVVDECTYGAEQDVKSDAGKDVLEQGTKEETFSEEEGAVFTDYSTYKWPVSLYLSSPPEDCGDYYMVRGNLQADYCMGSSDFYSLEEGEHFALQDKQFVKGKSFRSEGFEFLNDEVYCVDDDRTYYVCGDLSENVGSRFDERYVTLLYEIPDPDMPWEVMQPVRRDLGEQIFRLKKDVYVTTSEEAGVHPPSAREYDPDETEMDIFNEYEKYRKRFLEKGEYTTIEECVKNEILLDGWWNIATNSSIYGEWGGTSPRFYVTIDENGMIDTMKMDSLSFY